MRKPEESLEDFTVKAMAIEKAAEAAPAVSLRSTGQVEVLKPLASREGLANRYPATENSFVRPAQYRFSWLQGSLAAAGAVAMMAFVLLSAIFIGIYDPPPGPELATVDNASDAATDQQAEYDPAEGPLNSDNTAQDSPPADVEFRPIRSTSKPGTEKPRVPLAAYHLRRQSRRPQPMVTRFVPTTLVIYAENGEIKTRIEPRLAAIYNKPLTITN